MPGMADATSPRTLFAKIWARHRVLERPDGQTLLYVDCHLVHDGSAPAFQRLHERKLPVRAPGRTFATPDHYVLTSTRDVEAIPNPELRGMVTQLVANTAARMARPGVRRISFDRCARRARRLGSSRPSRFTFCGTRMRADWLLPERPCP